MIQNPSTRLFLKTVEEKWVLHHVEIQGQDQNEFEKRMYVYNYRTFDPYDRKVASVAILADDNPTRLGYGRRDVILLFEFVDWVMSLPEELEESLRVEIDEIEGEMKMEYITSFQRIGRKEGLEEGRKEGAAKSLERLISKRFNVERQAAAPIFAGLAAE